MDTQKLKEQANKYIADFKVQTREKQLVAVGALVTFIGLFMPVVTGNVFGVSYNATCFKDYGLWALLILLGAGAAVAFTNVKNNAQYALIAAGVAAISTIIVLISVLGDLGKYNSQVSQYASFLTSAVASVSIGWGWILLIPGVALLFAPKLMPLLAKAMAKKPAAPVATPATK